jgi:hypothetical protein
MSVRNRCQEVPLLPGVSRLEPMSRVDPMSGRAKTARAIWTTRAALSRGASAPPSRLLESDVEPRHRTRHCAVRPRAARDVGRSSHRQPSA